MRGELLSIDVSYLKGAGPVEPEWLERYWLEASPRCRQWWIPDRPPEKRLRELAGRLEVSPLWAFGRRRERPFAIAWLDRMSRRTASVHFCLCRVEGASLQILAQKFLADAGRLFDCLIAMAPGASRGLSGFARACGFGEKARIPGICPVWRKGKIREHDGILLIRQGGH